LPTSSATSSSITEDSLTLTEKDLKDKPALFQQAHRLYAAMHEAATMDEETGKLVWEGHLTKFLQEKVGLAVPQYSRVRASLVNMGCIANLQRGTGRTPARWLLAGEPTMEIFNSKTGAKPYTLEGKKVTYEQRVQDLERIQEKHASALRKLADSMNMELDEV